MESLASSLQSLIGTLPSVSTDDMPVERLRDLPPTEHVAAELAEQRGALERLGAAVLRTTQDKAQFVIGALEYRLALCERRDAIQAGRPAGCWCLGLGGVDARYLPSLSDTEEPELVWDRYCTCPEATASKARADIARAHFHANRRAYRAHDLFRQADVPPRLRAASFDTYPVSPQTAAVVDHLRAWASDDANTRSILLYGPFGTGKTGLAVAAMRAAMQVSECHALFLTTPDLLDRIRATYGQKRKADPDEPDEEDVVDAARTATLLVLDDLGAERPTDWVQEKLFTVVNYRYDQELTTIFTSNLPPDGLAKHLGERTAWRIIEMCDVFKIDGPNLRDRK